MLESSGGNTGSVQQQKKHAGDEAEKPFEARVRSYNIDSASAVEALLKHDAEEQARQGEEKRLEELLSGKLEDGGDGDDGEEAYEFEDYAGEEAAVAVTQKDAKRDQKPKKSESGAWEKNEKTLVEADYDDDEDYAGAEDYAGDEGTSTSAAGKTAGTAGTAVIDDGDYGDYEDLDAAATTKTPSTSVIADLEDSGDGEAFLTAMAACDDLICIQEAHAKYTRASDMFNFPHFMIIGFQKAATTSLKRYLERHSQIDKPRVKEPNFFPYDCHEKPPERCSQENTTRYIQSTLHKPRYIDERGRLACMEASTHIVRAGHNLAPRMAKLMPWLKIIVQFREPISRAASMLIHNKDVNQIGCLTRSKIGHCLLHHSQLTEMQKNKYEPLTYTEAIQPWIEHFPKEQIHVIQYETLVHPEREAAELLRVKQFLGVDERRPQGGLEVSNARRFSINPEGWQVRKKDYAELIGLVEPDVESLVDLLYEHDLLEDKRAWVDQWRAHWNANLATCGRDNLCTMALS